MCEEKIDKVLSKLEDILKDISPDDKTGKYLQYLISGTIDILNNKKHLIKHNM